MHVYALTSSELLHETLDLYLTREAAEADLREILRDQPGRRDVLRVVPIELDGRNVSANQSAVPGESPPSELTSR
jgi:hypothetical protein